MDVVRRVLALIGVGLLAVFGLLGAIVVSSSRLPGWGPGGVLVWLFVSGVLHLVAASEERSVRIAGSLALASELPLVAALVVDSWPLQWEEWMFLVGFGVLWTLIAAVLWRAAPDVEGDDHAVR